MRLVILLLLVAYYCQCYSQVNLEQDPLTPYENAWNNRDTAFYTELVSSIDTIGCRELKNLLSRISLTTNMFLCEAYQLTEYCQNIDTAAVSALRNRAASIIRAYIHSDIIFVDKYIVNCNSIMLSRNTNLSHLEIIRYIKKHRKTVRLSE